MAAKAEPAAASAPIVRVVIDGRQGSGKSALRLAVFGSSFTASKILPNVVQFTSAFARLVVYEIQDQGKDRLKALNEMLHSAGHTVHVYWYLYDTTSPVVFTADLLEGTNNATYQHIKVLLTKSDTLSSQQLDSLSSSIVEKLKGAAWIKNPTPAAVVTERKLVLDPVCPSCSSKNIFVNHKQLRWMCSDCNKNGAFPGSANIETLIVSTARAVNEGVVAYFVGAQQGHLEFKKTFSLELVKQAAAQGETISGVGAVERATKNLWVDLGVVWVTQSAIASKLLRMLSFSLWLSSFSERLSWVISELVVRHKNAWTIACSGALIARILWLSVGVEYKLHTDSLLVEQSTSMHELILKASEGPSDLSRNLPYIRMHAIIDEEYMHLWQGISKQDGYEKLAEFLWTWKTVDFTLNRSGDAVLGDLLKGRHMPTRDDTIVALAPIYLQGTTETASNEGLVPVPYSPSPSPIAIPRPDVRK